MHVKDKLNECTWFNEWCC